MDFISNLFQQGFAFVVPLTILLGVLIFIHELGHFLVAKYFNVKVETFSLGFGPKIFKVTRGETTYCLSAIQSRRAGKVQARLCGQKNMIPKKP